MRGLLERLDVVGVLCVEFFLTPDGALLINELAPRPHNSGHLTIDACVTSQFEQQVRAICGLPPGSTELLRPAAMANLLGDLWADGEPDWAAACLVPASQAAPLRQGGAAPRPQDGPPDGAVARRAAMRCALSVRRVRRFDQRSGIPEMNMTAMKRVEIVVDADELPAVITMPRPGRRVRVTRWFHRVTGKGKRGDRSQDELAGSLKNGYMLCACTEPQARAVADAVRGILRHVGGVCLINDCVWVEH